MHRTEDVQVVVDLGNTHVRVMAVTPDGAAPPTTRVLDTNGRMPALVGCAADGAWTWGVGRARGRTVIGGFLARVDDPVPLVIGEVRVSAAQVVARQLEDAVALVAAEHGRPGLLTVIHPDDLTPEGRGRVEAALGTDPPVRWASRAAVSVDGALERGEVAVGDVVAALHVGGASCVATVWALNPTPRRLAVVRGDASCAGGAVDDLVVAHVRRSLDVHETVDPGALRASCEEAKTTLSTETSVDVLVGAARVRLVRTELEELSAPLVQRQLDTLAEALRLADVEPTDLRTVLLTGGGATAPSVVEAIGTRFATPARLMTRRASAVHHDPTVVVRPTPSPVSTAPTAAAGGTRRLPGAKVAAAHLHVRRLTRSSWPRTRQAPTPRMPVLVGSALVAVLLLGGGAVQQAGLVGILATALGTDGPGGASARTLASGVVAPFLNVIPELPEGVVVAIEEATRTVTGGDSDNGDTTDTGDTATSTDVVRVNGPGVGTAQSGPGSTSPRTPGATRPRPDATVPTSDPGPTTDPTPDPDPAPDPTPDPEPDPDPAPDPAPDPTPDPDPPSDPAPDPEPDPDPPPDPPDETPGDTPGSDPVTDPTSTGLTAPDQGPGDGSQP